MKHTPGPWTVCAEDVDEKTGEYDEPSVVTDSDNPITIAIVRVGLSESDANAHLIASAPELLEACTALTSAIRNLEGQPIQYSLAKDLSAALSLGHAAMKKADGSK